MDDVTMSVRDMDLNVAAASMDAHSLSRFHRAGQLLQGGWVQDQEEMAALFLEVAERSNAAEAEHNMGSFYQYGVGVPRNFALAVTWYSKAAAQGLPVAAYALARCYHVGRGVSIHIATAAAWYRRGAERGDSRSQCELGMLYKDGEGVPQNHALAVQWLS